MSTPELPDLVSKIVSLSKRRGFVFQSSEIYGGLKSCYDYGPLGAELKRNIANEWWRAMVHERDDIVGLDASIIMHPKVWETSGHLANFSDPLVDCKDCKERFRADHAPKADNERGYQCPNCSSANLSEERQFHGMFRTSLGPIDPLAQFVDEVAGNAMSAAELREKLDTAIASSAVYLRPETAQAMFVQFLNVQQSMAMRIPFGIAQVGKSFRNEIVVEHFVFRSCEFEQMEMEFFIEPGSQDEWMKYWCDERMRWYRHYAHSGNDFRLREHEADELAHYSTQCFDVEYRYPWGWGELEGIASRTDYDLKAHAEGSGTKLSYFDQQKTDPKTGKGGWRYTPYVIEPAAGLTRTFLCLMLDAYREEKGTDAQGNEKSRTVLMLHPRLAPYKAAVLPLVKKDGQPEKAAAIAAEFRAAGIHTRMDDKQSIGKRYAKHDEIGTPYCLTVDNESLQDEKVTIRDRDDAKQDRVPIKQALATIQNRLQEAAF